MWMPTAKAEEAAAKEAADNNVDAREAVGEESRKRLSSFVIASCSKNHPPKCNLRTFRGGNFGNNCK